MIAYLEESGWEMPINLLEWGKPKCFPGATSNQLLDYLGVNLQDNNTKSVILHAGVNDVIQGST